MKKELPREALPDSPATLEAQGWAELEAENWAAALKCFQALPQDSEAAFQGQSAAFRKMRIDSRARAKFEAGLEKYPTSQGLLMERVWLAAERKQFSDALQALERVLETNWQDSSLFLYKFEWLCETRQFPEAAATLEQVGRQFPRELPDLDNRWGWLHFSQGLYEEAQESFKRTLERDRPEEAKERDRLDEDAWRGQVACFRKKALYSQGHELLDRAQKHFPESDALQNERAWLYFADGSYPEAAAAFEVVRQRRKDQPSPHVNQAWVFIQQGHPEDLERASALCREALRLQALFPPAFSALGVIAFKQKRSNEAEAYLLEATRLEPVHGPWADLGALYIQLGRYAEAEEALQQAAHFLPDGEYVHLHLGSLHLHTERTKDAIREFRQAAGLAPLNPEPSRALAIALLEAGEPTEAEQVLRQAIKRLRPTQTGQLYLTLAQLLLQRGDETAEGCYYEEATVCLSRADLVQHHTAEIAFFKGLARFKLGDYPGALKSFRSCRGEEQYALEAGLNAGRVKALIEQQKAMVRTSRPERLGLGVVILLQLAALWYFRLSSERISDPIFMVVVPLLLGMLVIAILLPWLTKFKVTGFEAELSEPTPRSSLAYGPRGEDGFHAPKPTL